MRNLMTCVGLVIGLMACNKAGTAQEASEPESVTVVETKPVEVRSETRAFTVEVRMNPELLCESCTEQIKQTLGSQPGVATVDVDRGEGLVSVHYGAEFERDAFVAVVERLPQWRASDSPSITWADAVPSS